MCGECAACCADGGDLLDRGDRELALPQVVTADATVGVVPILIADAEQEIECARMTTQQKITAIQAIVANHQDNIAAMRAANVGQGLEALAIEAMNTAFKDDLALIFSANSSRLTAGKQTGRAVTKKVRRRRQT